MIIEQVDRSALPAVPKPYNPITVRKVDATSVPSVDVPSLIRTVIATVERLNREDRERCEREQAAYDKALAEATHPVYLPPGLTANQLHKLQGTEWAPKERGQQTYPQGFMVLNATICSLVGFGYGVSSVVGGSVGIGILSMIGSTLLLLMAIVMDYPVTLAPLHNARIKRTKVDGIKKYQLDSPVAELLQDKLGADDWTRLYGSLSADDNAVLGGIFIEYYETAADVLESRDEVESSSMDVQLMEQLSDQLTDKLNQLIDDSASEIKRIFVQEDLDAREAEMRAIEEADAEAFAQQLATRMNADFLNQTIVNKAAGTIVRP